MRGLGAEKLVCYNIYKKFKYHVAQDTMRESGSTEHKRKKILLCESQRADRVQGKDLYQIRGAINHTGTEEGHRI